MDILGEFHKRKARFQELEGKLAEPSVLSDPKKLRVVHEEYSDLRDLMAIGDAYEASVRALEAAKAEADASADPDMRELARSEVERLEAELPALGQKLISELVPPDPLDKKNIIVEIRAG